MTCWERKIINTARGSFEVFVKGEGNPICVTHHYSEFNHTGDYFANSFTENNMVYLVNLKEAGNSGKAHEAHELSMFDAVYDLEAIRETLGYAKWTFAGHSTGGMIGVIYGIHFSTSLTSLIIVGAAARKYANSSAECIYHPDHPHFDRMQHLIEVLKRSDLSPNERERFSKERTKLSLFHPDKYDEYFSLGIHKKMSAPRMNFFIREEIIFDVTRELEKISTNTLILSGRYDVQCPLSFSIEMNKLIPKSELVIFNESNHYPFLEEKMLFSQVISTYLKETVSY
ncbi:alpha/beta hydrolase [Bacillus sp. ISL-35]|uniref:alpha/beta fold hydrolase n=1 Tax=Bacillus sp. ISL-35 TaxID=2819122 RepID=UPI001BE73F76|nr:alpha/beta hydrolase [Bacillus sp. ISL-35]MBT2680913.1 alpha/beta hydrolase [Bacillus sp. ISL-35]MBT2705229.1 alpha/beta hydrolase [Chryseobacterium sp. ISL-80]